MRGKAIENGRIVDMTYGNARRIVFHGLAELLQEGQGASEVLTDFLLPDESDALDGIATNFDLDSVYIEDVYEARQQIIEGSQRSLIHRGLPAEFIVFRGGPAHGAARARLRPSLALTATTLDVSVARHVVAREYRGKEKGVVCAFAVRRADVLADVDAVFGPLRTFDEQELLVDPDDLHLVECAR